MAWLLFLLLVLQTPACRGQEETKEDRQPVVAGTFYPAAGKDLRAALHDLFELAVPSKHITDVAAIIVPHAGYVYSGTVAASAFNQLDPDREYGNVFIVGSSHRVLFDGASIYRKGDFITPLGAVHVNREIADRLIREHPFFSDRDDAHAGEHCIEVEVPFLQSRLKRPFSIVPIVIGSQSPATIGKIADALKPYLTPGNLFVISTDFSHYPAYDDAVRVDGITSDAILKNSASDFTAAIAATENSGIPGLATAACGWTSVLALLSMTEGQGGIAFTGIAYANSGDVPAAGDRSRVVGYNAIVVSRKEAGGSSGDAPMVIPESDRRALLALARSTIAQHISARTVREIDTSAFSDVLRTPCGAFVTLNENSELRGCIGRFEAGEPLYRVVQEMAIAAATEDYRFPPVREDEIGGLKIEISVLTPMRRMRSIDEIELGRHGIYIVKGAHHGTFLPQVATETGWSKEEFLGHCAQEKAGLAWDGWKDAEVYIYEAIVFGE